MRNQGLQVGPDPLLLPVLAGVGDDQRRLRGERHQDLLIFVRERGARCVLAEIDVTDRHVLMTDRGDQKGSDCQGLGVGEAERSEIAAEVEDPQRGLKLREVPEQLRPARHGFRPLALRERQPLREEALHLPRGVHDGDRAGAGASQRPGAGQHPVQHRVQVEAGVDAQAGCAQPGQFVPQRRVLAQELGV